MYVFKHIVITIQLKAFVQRVMHVNLSMSGYGNMSLYLLQLYLIFLQYI